MKAGWMVEKKEGKENWQKWKTRWMDGRRRKGERNERMAAWIEERKRDGRKRTKRNKRNKITGEWVDKRRERKKEKQMKARLGGWKKEWIKEREIDGWKCERKKGNRNLRKDRWMDGGKIKKWKKGCMKEWMQQRK